MDETGRTILAEKFASALVSVPVGLVAAVGAYFAFRWAAGYSNVVVRVATLVFGQAVFAVSYSTFKTVLEHRREILDELDEED